MNNSMRSFLIQENNIVRIIIKNFSQNNLFIGITATIIFQVYAFKYNGTPITENIVFSSTSTIVTSAKFKSIEEARIFHNFIQQKLA